MKILPILIFVMTVGQLLSQKVEIVQLEGDGNYSISILKNTSTVNNSQRSMITQLEGYPFSAPAHPTFKNFRNVSIADLNNDQEKEIVVCLNETLFALRADGSVLWKVGLEGTSNFPPAIADIDGDGNLEIAVQTYGVPAAGNVYLFDHQGTIQDGWPINIDNHFFLNGITMADLDKNGTLEIIASERVNSNSGRVHVLKKDGSTLSGGWPVSIPGTPAFTPSVGDINQDGTMDLITCTTTALYAFDATGSILQGFPLEENGAKFSYQSPILADLNDDNNLEIVTARHNELPGTTVVTSNGSYYGEWPDYDNIWTFATPAVVDIDGDGDLEVFYGRPYSSDVVPGEVVLGYDHEGNRLEGFSVIDLVGSEGLLAIADIDNDGDQEIITASKASIDGMGLIQAYHSESGDAVSNFPLFVKGFTFLNGAYLSDINNDGTLDLTALSYQLKFNPASPDSAFVNVFNLEVPYNESTILFNGYKGSNSHDGLVELLISQTNEVQPIVFSLSPNPVEEILHIDSRQNLENQEFSIFNTAGHRILSGTTLLGNIDLKNLSPGIYLVNIGTHVEKFIKL